MEPINFFKNDIVSFDFGGEFKYKALIAEDELSMDMTFCYFESQFDIRRYNILRLAHNLVEVPFSKEELSRITGKDSSWNDLKVEDRIKVILKLSTSTFQAIIKEADKLDYSDLELKKN